MTDERLRELERRWKESGSVEDEAAYLLERVRVGDLEQKKLELAAYCGHEGARLALGGKQSIRPPGLHAWGRGLERWGKPTCVRAAVTCAVTCSESWPSEIREERPEAQESIRLTLDWLDGGSSVVGTSNSLFESPDWTVQLAFWAHVGSAHGDGETLCSFLSEATNDLQTFAGIPSLAEAERLLWGHLSSQLSESALSS